MNDRLEEVIASAAPLGVPLGPLWSSAYQELKLLARSRLRRGPRNTLLDTTALVNEAYSRLATIGRLRVEHRGQFFAYCSRVMHSVIVDLVREAHAERRGGGAVKITLNTGICEVDASEEDPLRVDEALKLLAEVEPRLTQIVEMRYFGGFNELEIAEALGITDRTVRRDWQRARVLLRTMLAR